MLKITIPGGELWDERTNEFLTSKETTLELEHSLVSLARWESKWNKPFLTKEEKTYEETIDYIRCMTITQNVNPLVYASIPKLILSEIKDYIDSKQTATWFAEDKNQNRDVITAEIIYYWMISQNIPVEFQKWHLHRLLTLIRVCSIKNAPKKKMNRKEMLAKRREMNASRRAQYNTRG